MSIPPTDADVDFSENYYIETYPLDNRIKHWMKKVLPVEDKHLTAIQNCLIVHGAKDMMAQTDKEMEKQMDVLHSGFIAAAKSLYNHSVLTKR